MNNKLSYQHFSLPGLNGKHFLFLFIVWPFLAFISALANYSNKESRRVVYLFLIYYGLTFVIDNEGIDASRYAEYMKANALLPFSDFFKIIGGIYTSDSSLDFVEQLISFIVSRFTTDHGILFAAYAAVFGFFYLKSINLLHNRYQDNPGWNVLVHLAFFTLILPVTAINGFRMWTAAWIFFYGAYHVILHHDARYLLLTIASSLVHFSFLSINIVLIIYFLAGNRNAIYLPIALLSFFIPQKFSPILQSISLKLGGGLQSRIEMYTSADVIIGRQESFVEAAWFLKIGEDLVFYYLILAIIAIQLLNRERMKEKVERNLFSFLLLLLAFVNFGKEIPSFGGRFQVLFFMFGTLYVFNYFLKLPGDKINLLTWIGLFPMTLYAAVALRQGSETMNAWLFTPGLGLPLIVPDITVFDFLFR